MRHDRMKDKMKDFLSGSTFLGLIKYNFELLQRSDSPASLLFFRPKTENEQANGDTLDHDTSLNRGNTCPSCTCSTGRSLSFREYSSSNIHCLNVHRVSLIQYTCMCDISEVHFSSCVIAKSLLPQLQCP